MKHLHCILYALLLLSAGCATLQPAPRGERYYDKLTPGNKAVGGSASYLIEKSPAQDYVLKQFYYETRQMTSEIHYTDAALRVQNGPCKQWFDDGKLWFEGYYKAGKKDGAWKEYSTSGFMGGGVGMGQYAQGEKEGWWIYQDSLGRLSRKIKYEAGNPLVYEYFNPDGTPRPDTLSMNAGPDSLQIAPSFPCDPKFAALGKDCGERSLMNYLAKSVKYPLSARQRYITGPALVSFVVNKAGEIQNVRVLNGVCDEIKAECYRVVSGMPRWTPGSANGKPVKVAYSLPIRFKLE